VLALAAWWCVGCAPVGVAPMEPARASGEVEESPRPAEERPGLATGHGRTERDPWVRETFVRASSKPAGTDLIYYNDRSGVAAMAPYRHRVDALQRAAGERIEWGVRSGFGGAPSYKSGRRRYVVGKAGAAYVIELRNRSRSRLEVVVSVDGLDVIDGRPATLKNRGYVIGAGESLEIKGWRTGPETVARFEFSSVAESYANRRHGDARNVGVIGVAVFDEKGVDPWKWMPRELRARERAEAFATAP